MNERKIYVTKRFTFEAAHMLAHHEGACRNIHGHSYKLEVTVKNNFELAGDMVVDFSHLKAIVKEKIVERYDHAFIYWENSDDEGEKALTATAIKYGYKAAALKERPTAENMLIAIGEILSPALSHMDLSLVRLKLWETEGSYGEVEFND